MPESLNVIALISGGKDSFFSLLHCLQNGHKVAALGNLHPPPPARRRDPSLKEAMGTGRQSKIRDAEQAEREGAEEHDLNSFMYQTVGHSVIPLYEKALGIPLYRQAITGSAVQTGISYSHPEVSPPGESGNHDETESLLPLLQRIKAAHPEVNALSTGAILSTYQRTRIESVALRLGLTPLAYLWKYPVLPPGKEISLLWDMHDVGLDARIVKVASGGLDERFLWDNVASEVGMRRVERAMGRFGSEGDGGVLGEGGEFETLVVDGPQHLFKGRIEVREEDRGIVREGGGLVWLRIRDADVVMKSPEVEGTKVCRIPDLLERRFEDILSVLNEDGNQVDRPSPTKQRVQSASLLSSSSLKMLGHGGAAQATCSNWTVAAERMDPADTVTEEAEKVIAEIRRHLSKLSLDPSNIISTVIILRSMNDFAAVNKVYGALFTEPNPPARVTISCGEMMAEGVNIVIHITVQKPAQSSPLRKALHVQSRSYWAPANIGPYSQAISVPLEEPGDENTAIWAVSVAGQIPLIPHTMILPSPENRKTPETAKEVHENFNLQTVLALQHLWRIGDDMDVKWWTSAVAYLPRGSAETISTRASIASQAWSRIHSRETDDNSDEDTDERDLWEEKHYAGLQNRGGNSRSHALPDWSIVQMDGDLDALIPPVFAVEVEELPRQSQIEWHAHLGVVNGPVKHGVKTTDGYSIYQCTFGRVTHSVITVYYTENEPEFGNRLEKALKSVGIVDISSAGNFGSVSSYLDGSISKEAWASGEFGGLVVCRSIWDTAGRRVGAVLMFDTGL